jgi:hypothetical protein
MCPRRGRDGWVGPYRSELMRVRKNKTHHRSRSKKLLGVAGGKRKRFWCFKPDQEMGERTAGRKEVCTRAALSVHTKTPLYAYARSLLHPRPASSVCRDPANQDSKGNKSTAQEAPLSTSAPTWSSKRPLSTITLYTLRCKAPLTITQMRRKGLRAEIVVSARIRLFAGTNEVFDRVLQLARLTFPRMVAIESGEIEEA